MTLPDILIVDDDPGMIQLIGRMLAGTGRLRFATSGAGATAQVRKTPPDLMLLDAELPDASGFEVCQMLQADPLLREVPVIFVTGHSDQASEVAGLNAGAVDFISKPVSEPLLLARVRTQLRVKQLTDELRRIATHDALTGVANRRAFDAALEREWRAAWRQAEPISLLMIDVDHFKRYNDLHGHPAGDACLRQVADALRGCVSRPSDFAARYGGEEFVLLLPKTARAGARAVAERVLDAVQALALPHGAAPTPNVTLSIGIACYDDASPGWLQALSAERLASPPAHGLSAERLLQAADQALYAAKTAGRARAESRDIDCAEKAAADADGGSPWATPDPASKPLAAGQVSAR